MVTCVIRCTYGMVINDGNYLVLRNTIIEIKTAFISCVPLPVDLLVSNKSKSEDVGNNGGTF